MRGAFFWQKLGLSKADIKIYRQDKKALALESLARDLFRRVIGLETEFDRFLK
ncbi:MAG: hypothetical protein ACJA2Q_002330 [Pseudohongiellaceae bacterium]